MMEQDSRKAFEVTVKIHILTLYWPSHFSYLMCPEGRVLVANRPSLDLFLTD